MVAAWARLGALRRAAAAEAPTAAARRRCERAAGWRAAATCEQHPSCADKGAQRASLAEAEVQPRAALPGGARQRACARADTAAEAAEAAAAAVALARRAASDDALAAEALRRSPLIAPPKMLQRCNEGFQLFSCRSAAGWRCRLAREPADARVRRNTPPSLPARLHARRSNVRALLAVAEEVR
jgi:hypothetical protein